MTPSALAASVASPASVPPTSRTSVGKAAIVRRLASTPSTVARSDASGDSIRRDQRLIHARFAEAVQGLVRGLRHRPLPGARQPHQHGHIGCFAVPAQAINRRRPDGRVGLLSGQVKHGGPRGHVRQVRQHAQQDQLTGGLHGGKRRGHGALQGRIRGRRVGGHGGFTHGGVFALHHLGHQFDRLGLRQRADQSLQGRHPDELGLGGLHQVAVDGDGLGIRAVILEMPGSSNARAGLGAGQGRGNLESRQRLGGGLGANRPQRHDGRVGHHGIIVFGRTGQGAHRFRVAPDSDRTDQARQQPSVYFGQCVSQGGAGRRRGQGLERHPGRMRQIVIGQQRGHSGNAVR